MTVRGWATVVVVCAVLVGGATGHAWGERVRIELRTGDRVDGEWSRSDERGLWLKRRVGEGTAWAAYATGQIARMAMEPPIVARIESVQGDVAGLERLWERLAPALAIEGSDVGAAGLALCEVWLARGHSNDCARIGTVLTQITANDPDEGRRARARSMEVGRLVLEGRFKEARAAAAALHDLDVSSEAALASAAFARASAAEAELAAFELEHPRWGKVPTLRRERSCMVQRAMDGYCEAAVIGMGTVGSEGQSMVRRSWERMADLAEAEGWHEESARARGDLHNWDAAEERGGSAGNL